MIEYVKGSLTALSPATAVVETGSGVAFMLNISLNTFAELEKVAAADIVRLYVHEAIRDDAWTLYGFIDEEERALFRALIGVSGVGSGTARVILSSHTVPELQSIIAGGDVKALKQIKGVGAKTAERIVVDLRDKIKVDASTLLNIGKAAGRVNEDVFEEALAALVMLGFARTASQKVLNKLFASEPGLRVEVAIKKALSML